MWTRNYCNNGSCLWSIISFPFKAIISLILLIILIFLEFIQLFLPKNKSINSKEQKVSQDNYTLYDYFVLFKNKPDIYSLMRECKISYNNASSILNELESIGAIKKYNDNSYLILMSENDVLEKLN